MGNQYIANKNAGRYVVYKGLDKNNQLVYIGTTSQRPQDRFRWHKSNGKDLTFVVLHTYSTAEEMLAKEFELIKSLKPKLNKLTHRKQNFNAKLSPDELKARVGDDQWCQSCLKRRVNDGYKQCAWCASI